MGEFLSIGIGRHRMGSDGIGVTTLVGGHGCPLACKYCLNPQCNRPYIPQRYNVESLYEALQCDALYFDATGGGVTFGGGEPLLQAEFIAAFIAFCREKGKTWRFSIETSLAVEEQNLSVVLPFIDLFIVDVKDMDDETYLAYTGRSSDMMKQNLKILAAYPDRVQVKIPLIEGFNTTENQCQSENALKNMGFTTCVRLKYSTKINK